MSSPGIGVQQWANSILALPAFLMIDRVLVVEAPNYGARV
jgi:hypothetical protein